MTPPRDLEFENLPPLVQLGTKFLVSERARQELNVTLLKTGLELPPK